MHIAGTLSCNSLRDHDVFVRRICVVGVVRSSLDSGHLVRDSSRESVPVLLDVLTRLHVPRLPMLVITGQSKVVSCRLSLGGCIDVGLNIGTKLIARELIHLAEFVALEERGAVGCLVTRLWPVVRVQKDKLLSTRYLEAVSEGFEVFVELLQDVLCLLFWNLENETLGLFNIESRDENLRVAGRDLNDVVATAHLLAFLVEDHSILVEDGRLSVHHCL